MSKRRNLSNNKSDEKQVVCINVKGLDSLCGRGSDSSVESEGSNEDDYDDNDDDGNDGDCTECGITILASPMSKHEKGSKGGGGHKNGQSPYYQQGPNGAHGQPHGPQGGYNMRYPPQGQYGGPHGGPPRGPPMGGQMYGGGPPQQMYGPRPGGPPPHQHVHQHGPPAPQQHQHQQPVMQPGMNGGQCGTGAMTPGMNGGQCGTGAMTQGPGGGGACQVAVHQHSPCASQGAPAPQGACTACTGGGAPAQQGSTTQGGTTDTGNPTRHYSINVTACAMGLEKMEAKFEKKKSLVEICCTFLLKTNEDKYNEDIDNICKTLKAETEKCIQNCAADEKGGCFQTTMLMNAAAATELRKRGGSCTVPGWVKQG